MDNFLIQWNSRGLKNKRAWLRTGLFRDCPIWAFQETFVHPGDDLFFRNRNLFRKERLLARGGGGLLLAVNSRIPVKSLKLPPICPGHEAHGISVWWLKKWISVVNVYAPYGFSAFRWLSSVIQVIGSDFLIVGDFNINIFNCSTGFQNNKLTLLQNWIQVNDCVLLNSTQATRLRCNGPPTLLDLTICSSSLCQLFSVKVHPDSFGSDHQPVLVSNISQLTGNCGYKGNRVTKSIINWEAVSNAMASTLEMSSSLNFDGLTEEMRRVAEEKTYYFLLCHDNLPTWWSIKTRKLLAFKRRYYRQSIRTCSEELWLKYKEYQAKLRKSIREDNHKRWDSVTREAGQGTRIYKVIRSFKVRSYESNQNSLFFPNCPPDSKAQADLFASLFQNHSICKCIPYSMQREGVPLPTHFTMHQLHSVIQKSKVSTPGIDNISIQFFKNMRPRQRQIILDMFNEVLRTSKIPEIWKEVILVPIRKPGKTREDPNNYRPISLTVTSKKIFEKLILNYLLDWSIQDKIFHADHYGFIPFKDCDHATYRIFSDFQRAKLVGSAGYLVALDIKGAYDNVWWDGLVFKLLSLGLGGDFCFLIKNLVQEPRVRVKWRRALSDVVIFRRGLLQGSSLSPFLFSVYLAELFEVIDSEVRLVVYADDIFLYGFHNNLKWIRNKLQENLNRVVKWLQYWNLEVSPQKCNAIAFGRKKGMEDVRFRIHGIEMNFCQSLRVLGFHFNRSLNNKHHIQMLRRKSFERLNLLKSVAGCFWGADTKHLLQIAQRITGSLIEGNARILSQSCYSEIKQLQVIINVSLRWATGLQRWCPIPVLLQESGSDRVINRLKYLATKRTITMCKFSEYVSAISKEQISGECGGLASWNTSFKEMITFKWIFSGDYEKLIDKIYTDTWPFQNKWFPPAVIQKSFEGFLQSIKSDAILISTDASRGSDNTHISLINHNKNSSLAFSIPHFNSVCTAEAIAILVAIKMFILEAGDYYIFTDSKSVLSSLKNLNRNSAAVISRIGQELQVRTMKGALIYLVWVPGHRGIPLNECADKLAREGPFSGVHIPWFGPEDWIYNIKLRYQSEMNREWKAYYGLFPNRSWDYSQRGRPHHSLVRGKGVVFARFLTRTVLTRVRMHKFFHHVSPFCRACRGQLQDEEHLVLGCNQFAGIRRFIFRNLSIADGLSYSEVFVHASACASAILLFTRYLIIISSACPRWPG